jgi:hypothetical protein
VSAEEDDRRGRRLLVLGALLGAGLAAAGIVRSGARPEGTLPDGAVALVNGVAISRESFAQFVGAVAQERRETSLDAATRQHLLERMIDEELLLQRGLALDLARFERTARRAIVSAVVAMVSADAESGEPSEDALQAFLAQEEDRFRRPGRVTLELVHVRVGAERPEAVAYRRALEAVTRLRANEDALAVASALGDPLPVPLPAGALTADEVREILGPSSAAAAESLAVGATSDPVRSASGWLVLRLRAREPGAVPPFDEIRSALRAEWQRAAGERALTEYLAELRAAATLVVSAPDETP